MYSLFFSDQIVWNFKLWEEPKSVSRKIVKVKIKEEEQEQEHEQEQEEQEQEQEQEEKDGRRRRSATQSLQALYYIILQQE